MTGNGKIADYEMLAQSGGYALMEWQKSLLRQMLERHGALRIEPFRPPDRRHLRPGGGIRGRKSDFYIADEVEWVDKKMNP